MGKDNWEDRLDDLTTRVEELERFSYAHEMLEEREERQEATGSKSRQWAVNTALTAVNTLVILVNLWLAHLR